MTAFLKTADLTQEQFLNLIENLQPNTAEYQFYIWMQAPDGWTLDQWDYEGELHWCRAGREPIEEPARSCMSRSTTGRLFTPDGELRWRVIPALGNLCWRTVFLGNVDWVGTALEDYSDTLNDLHSHRENILLWGRQTSETLDEWIELQIPHRFRHPITGNPERVKVIVEKWGDDTGEPHFARLCALAPYEEEE